MQAHIHPWEATLLSLAHEARSATLQSIDTTFDRELLAAAYGYCESLTAQHSRSFHLASALLPAAKRRAVRALYAFCRVTDDIVDRSEAAAAEQLEAWRRRIASTAPATADCHTDLVVIAWSDARRNYHIPWRYAEQLIDGVARDLCQTRYQTFEELAAYSYGVASTVGLMSMHIIGYQGAEAIPYAIKLGVALQVTNILRDVAEDRRNGRLYLPAEELASFGLTEADIALGNVTDRVAAFYAFSDRAQSSSLSRSAPWHRHARP